MSSELRYVEQIREEEESSAIAELKKALKQIFVTKSFASRFETSKFLQRKFERLITALNEISYFI